MSVIVELSPLQVAFWVLTGRGNQILWTEADVQEHYRQKRLKGAQQLLEETITPVRSSTTYQTKFNDAELMRESLTLAKISFTESKGAFCCNIPNNEVEIVKTSNGNYEFRIYGDCNQKTIQSFYEKVGQKYEQAVQKQICDNIKQQVSRSYNMSVESEEILEDNSVVITVNI